MQVLYLDESGDHRITKVDPSYPVFVLGGVIMDEEYARQEVQPLVSSFKREFFGHDDLILHTADITRNRGAFTTLQDRPTRDRFRAQLNELIGRIDFTVIACAIVKSRLEAGHFDDAADLYRVAFRVIVDQFGEILGEHGPRGRIRAERRRPDLDRRLLQDWRTIARRGTGRIKAATIRQRIASFSQHPKSDRLVGLELADLVLTPIGRHIIGRPDRPDWHIVRSKFHGGAASALRIIGGQD